MAERIFDGRATLLPSDNDYDWLGHGVYFWEHNAQRAFDFARELAKRRVNKGRRIARPAVVGAVIDLGNCLNLLNSAFIQLIRSAHADLVQFANAAGNVIPSNSGGPDLLLRRLDCAVIELGHSLQRRQGKEPFDSVRAMFTEGEPIYPNAGFHAKNHIQICVRNPACIKGYFRPLDDAGKPLLFK